MLETETENSIKQIISKMKLEPIKLDRALNLAYFKQNLKREDIELFKRNLKRLFTRINEAESEEHNKNIVSDFLKNTFYKENYEINTAQRKDLVIHKGNTSQTPVSVIIETKKPVTTGCNPLPEMMSLDKPNAKALHEIIHYYLKERITNRNKEIKHIIITNIYDWFIFDATEFEKYFYENKSFRNQYQEWIDKELVGTKTDWFYTEIAKPFVENEPETLQCVHINLLDFQNIEDIDDHKLINLYKIFSPEHLLKLPFANDYNKIDTDFYNELLHILGLEETIQGGQKLITRVKAKNRLAGSLLENTIAIIQSLHRLKHIERLDLYGETEEEQLFSIALELNITWLNRILFLKLLEAQLIKYHKVSKDSSNFEHTKSFAFLNTTKIRDFGELNELFFEVIAKKPQNRTSTVTEKFGELPYLNSSLFEQTELEDNVIYISQLKDRLTLATSKQTVLKDKHGKSITAMKPVLQYLFEFLNAYSFASDTTAEIQDDNRTIINAAVLGLIFEKLNGYKDGSFYTPSFITTYISRSVLKSAIVKKFRKTYKLSESVEISESWNELKNKIEYTDKEQRQKANNIFKALKIVDPAVGSGHFLVSVLNELVALKSELRILQDEKGTRLRGIKIENINDELVIISEETGEPFQYYVNNKHTAPTEIQEIQQTLFNEKRILIENCLFGVDINPKSVQICRLRLWIELLKNAYYRVETDQEPALQQHPELETLPNIDMNIKTGNSLISKFDTGLNIFERVAVNNLIKTYKINVDAYKSETDYDKKQHYKKTISNIKEELHKYAVPRDKYYKQFLKKQRELQNIVGINPQSETIKQQIVKLSDEVFELEKKYQANYYSLYANSLEWAIDFPEILSDNGEFEGFDIVLGNPPYIQLQKGSGKLAQLFENMDYETYTKTGDIYSLFYEKGMQLLKNNGLLAYITSNKWMRAGYGKQTRKFFTKYNPIELIDLGSGVFDSATVDTNILIIEKAPNNNQVKALDISKEKDTNALNKYSDKWLTLTNLSDESWTIANELQQRIKQKIEAKGTPLKNWEIKIYRGVLTGYNEAFIIDGKKKNELIVADPRSAEIIKPILRGRDIKRYIAQFADLWLINTHNGVKGVIPKIEVEKDYPAIYKHLQQYETQLKKRVDKGDHWTNLRNCTYIQEFEKQKIAWNRIASEKVFSLIETKIYINDSTHFFTGKDLKFLNIILNSKLYTWLLDLIVGIAVGGNAGNSSNVKNLFVIKLPEAEQKPFIKLAEKIMAGKKQGIDTTKFEKEIDKLVYSLYDLTTEEIAMIEGTRI